MKARLVALLERMTRREKLLIATLMSCVTLLVGFVVIWKSKNTLTDLRAEINELENAITIVQAGSKKHVETMRREDALKQRIQDNKIGPLTTTVERLARDIKVPDPGAPESGTMVRLPMTFPGTEGKTPLPLKVSKKKKKKRNLKVGQYLVQREHSVKLSWIPSEKLQRLLARLENSSELLFVTKLEVERRFNLPEQVRADFTVATYSWPEQDLE